MLTYSGLCGACCRPNERQTVVLETGKELMPSNNEEVDPFALPAGNFSDHFRLLVTYEIDGFRSSDRSNCTHVPGSLFWSGLPFLFSPLPFYDYYNELETLINIYLGSDFYTHALIKIPVPETRLVREIIYHCLIYNIPDSMYTCMGHHRFCLLFHYEERRNTIEVTNLAVLTHGGGPSFYWEDVDSYT